MKSPEEVFPERKAAQFDETGRPFHTFFFTGRPHFYQLLFDISQKIEQLNEYELQMNKEQKVPDENAEL